MTKKKPAKNPLLWVVEPIRMGMIDSLCAVGIAFFHLETAKRHSKNSRVTRPVDVRVKCKWKGFETPIEQSMTSPLKKSKTNPFLSERNLGFGCRKDKGGTSEGEGLKTG